MLCALPLLCLDHKEATNIIVCDIHKHEKKNLEEFWRNSAAQQIEDEDNVTYKWWVKTEYIMSLITKQDTVTDFVDLYCEQDAVQGYHWDNSQATLHTSSVIKWGKI
ncbi:hypothetical protein PR048_004101 [Dryococelus australis]|uniref:Uncharacterized protein n=1 Tax=Dryococelus australis TaxID=614101 RepID=A0ABQ9I4J2_9NEOP|nr:hypothetical protein PR048_004101 [Dryococelus australis]